MQEALQNFVLEDWDLVQEDPDTDEYKWVDNKKIVNATLNRDEHQTRVSVEFSVESSSYYCSLTTVINSPDIELQEIRMRIENELLDSVNPERLV